MTDNVHWHMNEQLDDGRPMNTGTDRHRDCLADLLLGVREPLAILGWVNTRWDVRDIHGASIAQFSCEDGCGMTHVLTMCLWACTCSDGERILRDRSGRRVAYLN